MLSFLPDVRITRTGEIGPRVGRGELTAGRIGASVGFATRRERSAAQTVDTSPRQRVRPFLTLS